MSTLAAVPPPPRSPSPRARDLIYSYAGVQLALLIMGSAFTAVGAPLTLVFCRGLPGELALTLVHQAAIGHVSKTEVQRNTRVNGRHPTEVEFTFEAGGKTYEVASTTLSPGALRAGVDTEIEYVPWRPQWARVVGGTYGSFPLFVAFVAVFPLIGLATLLAAVRSNRRKIRAFRDGQPTSGHVMSVGLDRSVTMNNRHPLKVTWEFEVLGKSYSGSLSSLNPDKLRDFRSGDSVTVLYDADDPKVNTVWVD